MQTSSSTNVQITLLIVLNLYTTAMKTYKY